MQIKIPASSANLGAGFDCLSIGLTLYNQYTIQTQTNKTEFSWNLKQPIPADKNKILIAYQQTCRKYNWKELPFSADCSVQIPIGIGLGSSANAILAGVLFARIIHKQSLEKTLVLQDALNIEKHPDNLTGCLYGGFNIATTKDQKIKNFHFPVTKIIHCLIVKTTRTSYTEENRKQLPKNYPRQDIIHNIGKSSLLSTAFATQNFDLLKYSLDDALHQKYRISDHLEIDKLKESLKGGDYYGLALSGSGPALIIFCANISQRILCTLDEHFSKKKEEFQIYTLKIDNQGAIVTD